MSDFILTGAVAQFNRAAPLQLPFDSSGTCQITITFVGTMVFPATLSAQATTPAADVISWQQVVGPVAIPASPIIFTITADASPVAQPIDIIQQNYLVTVTDNTGRSDVINIAVGNAPGYPAATLFAVSGYPDPRAFATTPSSPLSLLATATSSSLVTLTWTTPLSPGNAPIIGYQIQRETPIGSGFHILVANTNSTITTYQDFAVLPTTTYNYEVAAINAIGLGAISNTSAATTLSVIPTAPLNLITTTISNSQIDLNWNPPASPGDTPISGYRIFRESPTGGGFSVLVMNTGSTSTTYSDLGLLANTQYNYKVAAINGGGVGLDSNQSASTTLP